MGDLKWFKTDIKQKKNDNIAQDLISKNKKIKQISG